MFITTNPPGLRNGDGGKLPAWRWVGCDRVHTSEVKLNTTADGIRRLALKRRVSTVARWKASSGTGGLATAPLPLDKTTFAHRP